MRPVFQTHIQILREGKSSEDESKYLTVNVSAAVGSDSSEKYLGR